MRYSITRKRITRLLFTAMLLLVVAPGISVLGSQVEQGAQIRLQYASFDPLQGEPALAAAQPLQAGADGASMVLVQFSGPVLEEWKEAVQAGGVRLYDYIPDHAFIAHIDNQTAAWLRSLPFVRWVGAYYPAYRLPAALSQADAADQTPLEVDILALPDIDLATLADQMEALGGSVQSQSASEFSAYLQVSIPAGRAESLAALDGVVWVEAHTEMGLFNDVGGGIMYVPTLRTKLGLYGSEQIVAVADTGLDLGTTGSLMSDDFEGRIVAGQALCARGTWNDLHGHGTHVSGSVLGNGVLSGSNPTLHQYGESFAGVAPEARIYFQAIGETSNSLCIPTNLVDNLFKPAYEAGARIHSNSWGSTVGHSEYDPQAVQADQAAWNYKNMLIIFAAGNHGIDANDDGLVDYGSMASPGTAKNALAVGATENNRPSFTSYTWGSVWSTFFQAEPINSDLLADDIQGMAAFSSRGPTDDGRIKPDIVAPGTFILSTRSHDPAAGIGWAEYDEDYIYNGGTSMATPLTAGGAALVREWLTEARSLTNPSAALMKAVLLNGAADISPGQYTSPQEIPALRPNNVSGWGRVDLQSSLNPPFPRQVWLVDNTSGLATGGKATYTLKVSNTQVLSDESNSPAEQIILVEESPSEEASVDIEPALPAEALPAAQTTPQPPNNNDVSSQRVELVLESQPHTHTSSDSPDAPIADVPLVLDDGVHEMLYGVSDPDDKAIQFIWLNRFSPPADQFPFNLEQIRVLFDDNGGTANVHIGDAIDLVVYLDDDEDPTNGASLERVIFDQTIQAVNGTTWSVYDLALPVPFDDPGDVIIGVINRYVVDGVTDLSFPATYDNNNPQGRSWVGWWDTIPPDMPWLPAEAYFSVKADANWMIRGYGSTAAPAPTPSLTPSPTPVTGTPGPSPTPTPTPVSGGPLRLTLVWTDYPGSPGAANALVNNLDLEVVAPGGKHYYGNTGVYSAGDDCLRDGKWDACNNAEGVYIPDAPYGTYTVYVHGFNVPHGPQPFAVVASGDYLLGGGQNKKIYLPFTRR